MIKKFFLLALFLVGSSSFAQYLKGRVVDSSDNPLPGATVYYDGTTLSTITDEEGNFTLAYDLQPNRRLVFSYIGYQTVFLNNYNLSEKLTIALQLATNALREVVIKKDRFSRKEKMKIFKERFLGTTTFGKKTIIENENDIEFEYDEKTFVLKAYSDKPLIIINPSLGYKITYELVDFETNFFNLTIDSHRIFNSYYAGLCRYDEIDVSEKVAKHRETAFKGSSVHFFRNMISGVWPTDEFRLFEKGKVVNPLDKFSISFEQDRYKISIQRQKFEYKAPKDLIALYGLVFDKDEVSQIQFNAETIFVDAFGNNLSLREVSYSGEIALKCVGDQLPLNYGIK
jgi:hypothetical protein